jgi:hypothetical protein
MLTSQKLWPGNGLQAPEGEKRSVPKGFVTTGTSVFPKALVGEVILDRVIYACPGVSRGCGAGLDLVARPARLVRRGAGTGIELLSVIGGFVRVEREDP